MNEPPVEPNLFSKPVLQSDAKDLFNDHMEHRGQIEEDGCPYCGSEEVVWEADDGSYYCEACHTYI